ncbi:trypsin-like peptidase domain-containing protein [Alteromonas sp. ASW11-36]|uniref:Trypsin-like peptidase domain-containing protein n=1 Tax=Alteromonas arenosi TaxID=3055817 RepID=A0ABT7T093_9ALTE|nr:trypsin-like peptidase domain-containing protein [Alteromonas sp. ASW11-36]MDM7861845.1 trypsin-like peptidase domain-containing protein [Alteromonas sp. ASW11-36]
MASLNAFLGFIFRSVFLGLIVAALILLFIPDLRMGSGFADPWFSRDSSSAEKISYYDALAVSAPAVVNIYSVGIEVSNNPFSQRLRERTSLGSGVIMSENGYILTCYHVVENADTIAVSLQDSRLLEAEMVGFDVFTDLAVLKVKADNLHVMPQLAESSTRVGDVVMAIGNPFDLGQTITHGIVSRTGRNGLANYVDYIQTDAVLNQGNSGGALVDSNGVLVGITNASFLVRDNRSRVRSVDGVNFAVPYQLAKRVMDEIIASGKVTRGQLGFAGSEFNNRPGILVTAVQPGSPADVAGLLVNDILVAIDGIEVETATKTLDRIAETPPGTIMQLEVVRDGNRIAMQVVVGELRAPE